MTSKAKRLQDDLRKATTPAQMESALEAASSYVEAHPDDDLEPLTATMHLVQTELANAV